MDYPRDVITAKASDAIHRHGGPNLVRVFYKWNCDNCGERNVVEQPNDLPEFAACGDCGARQRIARAGFALHIRRSTSVAWDDSARSALLISKA
jgi:hypothetical protein